MEGDSSRCTLSHTSPLSWRARLILRVCEVIARGLPGAAQERQERRRAEAVLRRHHPEPMRQAKWVWVKTKPTNMARPGGYLEDWFPLQGTPCLVLC